MIIGNLADNPETRNTSAGSVTSFTVAVNHRSKEPKADFFRVSAWRQLGENCQKYLTKGKKVAVVGSVSASAYTTSSGEAKARLEINAEDVEFMSPKQDDQARGFVETNDRLPF